VSDPYREAAFREICQQQKRLEIAEIASDGNEIWFRPCEGVAIAACPRCQRKLCAVHSQNKRQSCPACENDLALAIKEAGVTILSPEQRRRKRIQQVVSGLGFAFWLGTCLYADWNRLVYGAFVFYWFYADACFDFKRDAINRHELKRRQERFRTS
jgi:hypothetical protein